MNSSHVERFLGCVEQYIYFENPSQPVEKVLLTFDLSGPAEEKTEKEGITVIMPE